MTGGGAIYYLHPLLAGPITGWAAHFERIAAMGFDRVAIAPPFLPGRPGHVMQTADHRRLHPALGGGEALPALARTAALAEAAGLELLMDLVIGSDAANAPGPPDPRAPLPGFAAGDAADGDRLETGWWQDRVAEWLDAGISGFRCVEPHRTTPVAWRGLIGATRTRRPDVTFLAWLEGQPRQAVTDIAGVGFTAALCSSWAWDFKDDWVSSDLEATAQVGRILCAVELPYRSRVAAGDHPYTRAQRALGLATSVGRAWLMPMGFEFGDRSRLDPVRARPEHFAALQAQSGIDLSADILAANRRFKTVCDHDTAVLLTPAGADLPMFWRRDADAQPGAVAVINARLDRSAGVVPGTVLGRLSLGAELAGVGSGVVQLAPGATVILEVTRRQDIVTPMADIQTAGDGSLAPRIGIEAVTPSVDDGRFPVKRQVGEIVTVEADIICDGHETVAAALRYRADDEATWHEVPMRLLGNDRWQASFPLERVGRHRFTVEAWSDKFAGLRSALQKLQAAQRPFLLEQQEAMLLIQETGAHRHDQALLDLALRLRGEPEAERQQSLLSDATLASMQAADLRPYRVALHPGLTVDAERRAAGFSNWYELFPRSQSASVAEHGTFNDVIARLPDIRQMGFDTLYFPPIHPIGRTNRKGRNNALAAGPDDPGSPYAIGSAEGGHDAIHPELGTLDDFRRLISAAAAHGLEIALDFAIQCSPDHPWLREHPDWFEWRPDGTIRFAENPPKKYEDIVNVDFYGEGARPALWVALRDVVQFWVNEGVKTFRVDNPHTKPFPFWEWMIGDIRARHPEVIFLAEAFTRPKVMYRLAKVGFSQSYTYFTWRNAAWEMREYLIELNRTPVCDFFRPHFFVNTPDINPTFLHDSGQPGFLLRAGLAATLAGLWGVYSGFELCEAASWNGREEYQDSEKYEIRHWDHDRPGHIRDEIRRLNAIRRANPALQTHLGIRFLPCSNEAMLCYVKATPDNANIVLVVASFDPRSVQEADITLQPSDIGGQAGDLILRDLFRDRAVAWSTGTRRVRIDPTDQPFEIWRVEAGEPT